MTRVFLAAMMIAAVALFTSISTTPWARAQDGPGLGDKTLYTSDIQYRFTRSPDNKALSVLFNNFGVTLLPSGDAAPTVTRVFPLSIPVTEAGDGAALHVEARGRVKCPDGVKCLVILWFNGQTKVLTISQNKTSAEFFGDDNFVLPGAEVYQATVILIAERETKRYDLGAKISVDSLDLTITPQPPAGAARK